MKVMNAKLKVKLPTGRPSSRSERQVRKVVTQKEKKAWKETEEMDFGRIVVRGEAWLLGDPHKVETSREGTSRILTRRAVRYVEGSRSVALEHDP